MNHELENAIKHETNVKLCMSLKAVSVGSFEWTLIFISFHVHKAHSRHVHSFFPTMMSSKEVRKRGSGTEWTSQGKINSVLRCFIFLSFEHKWKMLNAKIQHRREFIQRFCYILCSDISLRVKGVKRKTEMNHLIPCLRLRWAGHLQDVEVKSRSYYFQDCPPTWDIVQFIITFQPIT